MRSIWAGAISFGLVVIPVKLYAATEQRDITFRQVHRKDGARIQFRRVCTLDGEEVPYSDIAKGYELPTGDMVVLTDEDLADLPLVTAHRIEVLHFAPAAQVEPIYSNKAYYTEPDQAGARAYVLFRDALEAPPSLVARPSLLGWVRGQRQSPGGAAPLWLARGHALALRRVLAFASLASLASPAWPRSDLRAATLARRISVRSAGCLASGRSRPDGRTTWLPSILAWTTASSASR